MQITVKINFPDAFEFPQEYDFERCAACVFMFLDMEHGGGDGYCNASCNNICPFYGNDDVVEI